MFFLNGLSSGRGQAVSEKRKAVMVRFTPEEYECFADILARFPNVSASTLIRAVLMSTPRLYVSNALAKHAMGERLANED